MLATLCVAKAERSDRFLRGTRNVVTVRSHAEHGNEEFPSPEPPAPNPQPPIPIMDPETRQRLLELVYGLLPEAEAAELHSRIETDEELARAYADAQSTAGLFAEASKHKSPRIELKRPERPMSTSSDSPRPKPPIRGGLFRAPWARAANWTVGIAAAILLIASLGGYLYHRDQLADIAAEHLRLQVTGPAEVAPGVDNVYTIETGTITGKPLSAQIEFALYSPGGDRIIGHKETTDKDGVLRMTIPAKQILPSAMRMRVVALHNDNREEVDTVLSVEPIRYATQLSFDRPLYRPGETVFYRSLTLSRSGLAADREMPIHFEVLDPSGAVVPDSQLEGVTERGVGCGAFAIPPGLAGGEYTLVAKCLDEGFPEEKRTFFIRRYRLPRLKKELEFTRDSYTPGDQVVADFLAERAEGGPAAGAKLRIIATVDGENVMTKNAEADPTGAFQVKFELPKRIERGDAQLAVVVDDGGTRETIAKTIPINLGKVDVRFSPEGGYLVAGLQNRVYFTARDPLGKPVHIEGVVVGSGGTKDAAVETTHEGMGSFSFVPQADQAYRLMLVTPEGANNQPKLPDVSTDRKIVISTSNAVFAAGAPLEFNIRAAEPGLPLVAAAYCRGVHVGQQRLVTEVDTDAKNGSNLVVIPVAKGVGGVIRLTVYDYSTSPPKPVAERLVYRRMGRKLNVKIAGGDRQFSPGETVELSLTVTDEDQEPVAAAIGVAVTDDALLNLADDDTPGMPTHFLLLTEVENPEDLEDANFYLSDEEDAAVALDLLLGTQGWRRFVEKTLDEIEQKKTEDGGEEDGDKNGDDDERITRLVAMGGAADPPAMFDNLGKLNTDYQESLKAYQADRTHFLATVTTVSFFAGLGLVLFVAMLGLLKIVQGVHLWVPAVGVTVCCLIIGAILIDPSRLGGGPGSAVAFSPFDTAPMEVAQLTESKSRDINGTVLHFSLCDGGVEKIDVDLDAHAARALIEGGEGNNLHWEDNEREKDDKLAGDLRGDNNDIIMFHDHEGKEREENGRLPDGKDLKKLADLRKHFDDNGDGFIDGEWYEAGEKLPKNLEQFRFTVREYAHKHQPGKPGVRSDFAETLYWNPLLIAKDGKATVKFDLSDSVTTFRVLADAHGDGRIGSGRGKIASRIPFSLEPKLPLEVNAGDRIDLPLAVVNDSGSKLPVEVTLEHDDLVTLDGDATRKLELAADRRAREYFVLNVTGEEGDCGLTFRGLAGNLADAVERPLRVVPPGFPKNESFSGEIDGDRKFVVELPEFWVPGSLKVTLNAYPSTLADLQKGMESIMQEPYGCFEQASTSNYPNVLALQYMQEHDVANPAVTRRAKDLLKKGYVKLAGYECPKKGYEWFGGDPGHEALTAYGLMEFRDMAEVYDVDAEMIDRTAKWLLQRRDGKGGFQRNAKALDSFGGAPDGITNAYITWALSESGQEGIKKEIDRVIESAGKSEDPYLISLAAQSAFNANEKSKGRKLLERLARLQKDDGRLEGTDGSITRSGGRSLAVETTALAAMAWLADPAFTEQANKAIGWIIKSRGGAGGFGSTQATILALKALTKHSKASRKTLSEGTLRIKRDDQQIGEHAFGAGQMETIVIDGLEASLKSGENMLTVSLAGDNKMPYSLDVAYCTRKPETDENCPLRLSTKLAKDKINAGETVALEAELVNTTDEGQPMTIAILGLPAGLEPRPDQLEELKKAGTLDYYETRAREVICYWRCLKPKQKVAVKLDLIAAIPGKYIGPASRAYLYYTSEQKQWANPLKVEITRE